MKIKLITGFRKDQEYSIDAREAHKAYYLFLHPEERGIFENGLALVGSDIKAIEPDYNGTMGWNPTHQLDEDDWNEIESKGVDRKLRNILTTAKKSVRLIENNPALLNEPIQMLRKMELKALNSGSEELALLKSITNI